MRGDLASAADENSVVHASWLQHTTTEMFAGSGADLVAIDSVSPVTR